MSAVSQREAVASLHKVLGIGKPTPRGSSTARRKEIALAQVVVLESVLGDIRRKARETPSWASAYFSAATSVELQIAAIKKEARL